MAYNEDVILAADAHDLSEALGCSPDTVEDLRGMGVIASQGELWDERSGSKGTRRPGLQSSKPPASAQCPFGGRATCISTCVVTPALA